MFKGVISLFLIIGAVIIFFAETKGYFPEIKSLSKEVATYNEAIKTSNKVKVKIDEILDQYNSVSAENIDRMNKMMPSTSESMNLVVQLDDMMRQKGLVLKSVDIREISGKTSGSAKKNDSLETMTLSLRAQGGYSSFHQFLNDLENSLRLIDIASVKVTPLSDSNYDFSIEAVSYWSKSAQKI
ncbi:hypothetical protein C4572_03800 [Candidatus Parcubacteria bacterium]|nr:MAG: hypothetical protein C4572_03800 [Candidatus Parcubacteria bacterium]